ncbi:molecular chaperone HtpG [Bacillota bacterium LX-D]|nr:molecular chaperone HtpG [Bacillota bacterium LX-D]
MQQETGNISIHTENIFPIIKKWLYSDRDIFIRELISNGCDAISKLQRLAAIGEAQISPDTKYEVKVVFNKDKKTLKFIDNGIGMTAEEVKKYINQIAFSGAEDFIAKYKEQLEGNEIIGHFGLGFYSAFMVAERVQIDTLSYQTGAEAVQWVCDGGTEYQLNSSQHDQRGTIVTLYLSDENKEFLEEFNLRQIIYKYCSFLPTEIYVLNEQPQETTKDGAEQKLEPINDPHPLWLKNPKDCTKEEYIDFYKKIFHDFNDPLFWIHLQVDYPFDLKGILYFPKIKHEFETIEGQIKLYNNQVFVADNIKEIIPEFLMLLKGTIDFKDLPLNVSRSFLQKDSNIVKLSKHITKKVADKLTELFKKERENFNQYWEDIHPFVKYGCIREDNFYEKVKDIIIFRTINGEYVTLQDYLGQKEEGQPKRVFYVSDEKQQAQYINLFKEQGLNAVVLPSTIDSHFIQFLESKEAGLQFSRIDADLADSLKDNGKEPNQEQEQQIQDKLAAIFKKALNNDNLKVQAEALKTSDVPAIILLNEKNRRLQEMSAMFKGMDLGTIPTEETLIVNTSNSLIQKVLSLSENAEEADLQLVCAHIYDLAMLSHKQLEPAQMTKFIERSNKILAKIFAA